MTSSTSAAAEMAEKLLQRDNNRFNMKESYVARLVHLRDDILAFGEGKLKLEAQQTDDTLSGLRTKIEEIYTPDADFKDQVLELLGAKKACFWEALEGVPGKLWCLTHDTDHGLDSAKAEGKE